MTDWTSWLTQRATDREQAGLVRRLAPRPATDHTIDLAGNDYLGLARDPRVIAAAMDATRQWGASAGASRLVTGSLALHRDLEQALANYVGTPAGLVFSTGYHANLSVVTALADANTLVLSDAHIHASLIDAVRLSRAEVIVTAHNDVAATRAALAANAGAKRALILAESVYSVLGDAAPISELSSLAAEFGAMLVIDEAHSLGVHGAGLSARAGVAGAEHIVVTATMSKALGSQGGVVLANRHVIEHLVNTARPFIFDTGLAPAAAGAALAALNIARTDPSLAETVSTRTAQLSQLLDVRQPAGAVLSVPMPSPSAALQAQAAALAAGIRVGCFRPPSVPDGISRLRITASAGIPAPQWDSAIQILHTIVKEAR